MTRRATKDDAGHIARMRRRMFESMGVAQEATSSAEELMRAYAKRAVPAGEFVAWLAFVDGEVIGSAAACIIVGPPFSDAPDGRAARILNVFVDESWRCQGIARSLLIDVLDECARLGVGSAGLIATDSGLPVYEALGFRPVRELRMELSDWRPTGH